MRARKLDTKTRKVQIARAALDLIAKQGPECLSIAAVAEKVGIVPSAVYRHFTGKDAILNAILDLLATTFRSIVTQARAAHSDPLDRLRDIIRRHVRFLSENQHLPAVVASEIIFGDHPERRAKVRDILLEYLGGIEAILGEGQLAGIIREDVAPRVAALMLLGIEAPAAALWKVSGGAYDIVAHVEAAWPIYLAGVEKRPG